MNESKQAYYLALSLKDTAFDWIQSYVQIKVESDRTITKLSTLVPGTFPNLGKFITFLRSHRTGMVKDEDTANLQKLVGIKCKDQKLENLSNFLLEFQRLTSLVLMTMYPDKARKAKFILCLPDSVHYRIIFAADKPYEESLNWWITRIQNYLHMMKVQTLMHPTDYKPKYKYRDAFVYCPTIQENNKNPDTMDINVQSFTPKPKQNWKKQKPKNKQLLVSTKCYSCGQPGH